MNFTHRVVLFRPTTGSRLSFSTNWTDIDMMLKKEFPGWECIHVFPV